MNLLLEWFNFFGFLALVLPFAFVTFVVFLEHRDKAKRHEMKMTELKLYSESLKNGGNSVDELLRLRENEERKLSMKTHLEKGILHILFGMGCFLFVFVFFTEFRANDVRIVSISTSAEMNENVYGILRIIFMAFIPIMPLIGLGHLLLYFIERRKK
jgi:hypothetical protein